MFRSTRNVGTARRVADFVWPRIGFRRALTCQMLRLYRLKACPHRISLGFAAGAFASFLPLVGFHFLLAAALAFVIRGNLIASAVGTVVGNPITFPMIWFATYKVGAALMGQPPTQNSDGIVRPAEAQFGFNAESLSGFWQTFGETFWPMVVGALPLGLLCASACYLIVYSSLRGVQRRSTSFSRTGVTRAL